MSTATARPKRSAGAIPSELQPSQVTAVIDTREQFPLCLAPLQAVYGTLPTGDYSIVGLETIVAVERKGLGDLLSCVGTERTRFDKEVQRLLAYPTRALVVESTWAEIEAGGWSSKVTPTAALGSLLGWVASGLPVLMVGTHAKAGEYVAKILYTAARRRWREARALVSGALESDERLVVACTGCGDWIPRNQIRRLCALGGRDEQGVLCHSCLKRFERTGSPAIVVGANDE